MFLALKAEEKSDLQSLKKAAQPQALISVPAVITLFPFF
jgi:hypothetical protein